MDFNRKPKNASRDLFTIKHKLQSGILELKSEQSSYFRIKLSPAGNQSIVISISSRFLFALVCTTLLSDWKLLHVLCILAHDLFREFDDGVLLILKCYTCKAFYIKITWICWKRSTNFVSLSQTWDWSSLYCASSCCLWWIYLKTISGP